MHSETGRGHSRPPQGGCLDTPIKVTGPNPTAADAAIPAPTLLSAMLKASARVSDLVFSPGNLPHIEVSGQLVPVTIRGMPPLGAEDTRRIAEELIQGNRQALTTLREQGSCDVSYSLPGQCRFRVNIFYAAGKPCHRNAGHPSIYSHICGTEVACTAGRRRQFEKRYRAHYWPDRLGKVFHDGGGSRQNQRNQSLSHHHHRRSGGIHAPA